MSEYLGSNGAVAAHFEYDSFGRAVAATGSPLDFRIRFSTKKEDAETGLNYYGYRHYDSMTGRWLSRDPIEERDGYNVFSFVGNNGIGHTDCLGLKCCDGKTYDPEYDCCVGGSVKSKITLAQRDYGGDMEKCKKAQYWGSIASGLMGMDGTALAGAIGAMYPAALAGGLWLKDPFKKMMDDTADNINSGTCGMLVCPKK